MDGDVEAPEAAELQIELPEEAPEPEYEEVFVPLDNQRAAEAAGRKYLEVLAATEKPPRRRRKRAPKVALVEAPLAQEDRSAGPWLSVPGWRNFQHYGKRKTPWVKVQSAWLSDYRFLRLADHQKLALVLIWVLAAQTGNRCPAEPEWLQWKLGISSPVDLPGLIAAGFLELHGAKVEQLPWVTLRPATHFDPRRIFAGDPPGSGSPGGGGADIPAPHERPFVWPETGEDEKPTSELVSDWEARQP